MSRTPCLIALLLCAGWAPAAAQRYLRVPDAQLHRNAQRIAEIIRQEREADRVQQARLFDRRRARIVGHGPLMVAWWESIPAPLTERSVATADSLITAFGAVPRSFVAGVVLVQLNTTDTARVLHAGDVAGRRVVELRWVSPADTTGLGARVAEAVGEAYVRSLDTLWREWLPQGVPLEWQKDREGQWAMLRLTSPGSGRGDECLAAHAAACRQWLGLDTTSTPFLSRYDIRDLRAVAGSRNYYARRDQDGTDCSNGVDNACERFLERDAVVPLIPADPLMRMGVLAELGRLHGADAVRRALVDSTGTIADRLSRASGMSTDNFLAEWRVWTLSRGRSDRVSASFADTLLVSGFVSLILLGTARKGQWS